MKNYNYFRVLVCLLLVCALIISISPIKAHAIAAGSIVLVGGSIAVAGIIIGLGVLSGADSAAFDSLVSDVEEHLSSLGFIVDGYIEAWKLVNGLKVNYYVAQEVIEEVRSFLFSSVIESSYNVPSELSYSLVVPSGYVFSYSSGDITVGSSCYGFFYRGTSSTSVRLILASASGKPVFSYSGSMSNRCKSFQYGGFYFTYVAYFDSWAISNPDFYVVPSDKFASWQDACVAFADGDLPISLSYVPVLISGLTAGIIPKESDSFSTAYSDWVGNSVSVPSSDDEDKIYVPVGLGQTLVDTETKTQEQVWAGESTYSDADTGSGTVSGTVALPGWVQDGFNNLNNGLKDILSSLLSLPAALAAAIWALLPEWIQDGFYNMKTGFLDVLDSIAALPAAIWSSLPAWLRDGISEMKLGFSDVLDSIASLPVAIAEALAAVFVPSADYISVKVEALRGEFGFIDSVIATGEFIRDSVSGASGPPVIYVDLGRASSGNYGSQRVLLTDFSWYAPYKGQVDTVLSAALWAFFGWRVFLKLPGIIGGESGYISDVFFSSSSGRSGSDDKKKGGKG